ncbi:MAG: hypothetical protein SGI98_10505 [Verrucomicrobiota bacterium]|nr:hypothetical protein [Verrucomicrobiota bacterium]
MPKNILLKGFICCGFGLFLTSGCTPTVQLAAPKDAVKIDVNMKVEVVTRKEGGDPIVVTTTSSNQSPASVVSEPSDARRDRISEYKALLNRGVAGVNRKGLLEILPVGNKATDKQYIEKIITHENTDRINLLQAQAKSEGQPLDRVEGEFYNRQKQAVENGLSPVWVEVKNDADQWAWKKIP